MSSIMRVPCASSNPAEAKASLSFKIPLFPPTTFKGDPLPSPLFARDLSLQIHPHPSTESALGSLGSEPEPEPLHLQAVDPRALRSLLALMDMEAALHGAASHYGGPAALAEIGSALYATMFYMAQKEGRPWHHLFHFVNDAGHCENVFYALRACYGMAHLNLEKLQGFRSLQSPLTGHGEALHFPEGVLISNGPLGSALPQAQGLALGDALLNNGRVTLCTVSDGACMEGEAKESLAAIPGLSRQKKIAPFILIISDNDTKLSGRISEDSFSMEPTFKSLSALGWDLYVLEQGNDLQSCGNLFGELLSLARKGEKTAIAIQAKTLKGIGTRATAQSSSGGHGFPLKDIKDLPPFIEEIYGVPLSEIPSELRAYLKRVQEKAHQAKAAHEAAAHKAAHEAAHEVAHKAHKAVHRSRGCAQNHAQSRTRSRTRPRKKIPPFHPPRPPLRRRWKRFRRVSVVPSLRPEKRGFLFFPFPQTWPVPQGFRVFKKGFRNLAWIWGWRKPI